MAADPARDAQTRMWTSGDYPAIARHLLPISEATVATLDIQAGERVLDVGWATSSVSPTRWALPAPD